MDEERLKLYKSIEEKRNSKLIVYVTGDRMGWESYIDNDAVDYFVEHLDKIGIVPKISLLLYTNGGVTLAAWNIVILIRQFCNDFEIIVPGKARSAGTLMCLGANRIVMTKQATLGPIDPQINTPLNPIIPNVPMLQTFPVSVEAIKGFLDIAKHDLNIHDDKALSNILITLANQVHPLVLGEVVRASSQIQMLARKLLVNQIKDEEKIKKIISFLCSESGSHDYTINRREARNELGLDIETPNNESYLLINETYKSIRDQLELRIPFDTQVFMGSDMRKSYEVKQALLESLDGGTSMYVTTGQFIRVPVPTPPGMPAQENITNQINYRGWKHYD